MRSAILILAAGSSSRMGQPKQMLPLESGTLLTKVIKNTLKTKVDDVFVILGAQLELIKNEITHLPVKIITNSNYKKGLSSSIVVGIEKLSSYDFVLIILGDQPKIDNIYLNKMITEHKNYPDTIIASDYNGIKGVPALFPKKYYSNLLKLEGDKGAKKLLNSYNIPIRISASSVDLLDIDTPEEYQKLIQDITKTPPIK